MGLYINPTDGTSKEAWLARNAEDVFVHPPHALSEGAGMTLVCLVDNGPFTAAGVVETERDLADFGNPKDSRPKIWFWVMPNKIAEVCPGYKPSV